MSYLENIKTAAAALAGTLPNHWEGKAIGVDVSKYNLLNADGTKRMTPADFKKWVDAGVDFLCAKCGDYAQQSGGSGGVYEPHSYVDLSFDWFVQEAWNNNIPLIAYYYFYSDPVINKDDNFQFRIIKDALKGKAGISVHGIAIDLEAPPPGLYGPLDTPNNITTRVRNIIGMLNSDPMFANMPVFIYSSSGFLTSYASPLINYIGQSNPDNNIAWQWLAEWPTNESPVATWDEILHGKYLPSASRSGPKWAGNIAPKIWQWRKFHGMDGVAGDIDLDVWLGTVAQMRAFFPTYKIRNTTPTIPPVDPVEPPVEPPVTPPSSDLAAEVAAVKARLDEVVNKLHAV